MTTRTHETEARAEEAESGTDSGIRYNPEGPTLHGGKLDGAEAPGGRRGHHPG